VTFRYEPKNGIHTADASRIISHLLVTESMAGSVENQNVAGVHYSFLWEVLKV
jgi:hypothetical protein